MQVSLTASVESACPEQEVNFTCVAKQTAELRWTYRSEEALFVASDRQGKSLPRTSFKAVLTENVVASGNLRNMKSVLSTTVRTAHNASAVTCSDGAQSARRDIMIVGLSKAQ